MSDMARLAIIRIWKETASNNAKLKAPYDELSAQEYQFFKGRESAFAEVIALMEKREKTK